MAVAHDFEKIDSQFYQTAEAFFPSYRGLALTYDDVTLATLYSCFRRMPSEI